MKLQQSMAAMIAAGGLVLGLSTAQTGAATRYVWQESPSPGPPYANWATAAHVIQEAVDAAQPGETVLVTNGVYATGGRSVYETMTNRVVIDRAIRVASVNGPSVTVIKGAAANNGGNGDGAIRCAYLSANAIIEGFTLTNGHTRTSGDSDKEQSGGAVWAVPPGAIIRCTITGNSANWTGGGVFKGVLFNCALIGNRAPFGGGTFYSTHHNCTFTGNSASEAGGAYGGLLYNCSLTSNAADLGGGTAWNALYNCIVYGNTASNRLNHYGAKFVNSCTTPLPLLGEGNIDDDPQLASTTHLSASSPCVGAGGAAYSSGVDIDGESWANPPCIGADQLTPGSATGPLTLQIQASDIHAKPGYVVSFTALNTGPILRSVWDFGDGTLLTNRPFASHAWSALGIYTVRLTGYNDTYPDGVTASLVMTVSDGVSYVNQTSSNPVPPYTSWETASTDIQSAIATAAVGGVVLVTNGVYGSGQLASADTVGSRVSIIKSIRLQSVNGPSVTVIAGAAGTNGVYGDGAIRCVYLGTNVILSGFTLTNGHAGSGGGVWCEASSVVSNCVLTGNSAQGDGGGAIGGTLYNCALRNNSAEGVGGGAYASTLYNSTLTGNSAGDGGGAFASGLYNCTVTLNSSQGAGGGAGGDWRGESRLQNCIVYHNTARGSDANYSGASLFFSCATPLPPGEGNIDADPQLASATHLSAGSPCIGAGSATNISGVDIDGEPWADPPCIGADQFTSGNATGPVVVSIEAAHTTVAAGFPISFTGFIEGWIASSFWDFGDGTRLTNRLIASHAWTAPGIYTVTLGGFNESFPQGVSSQIQVTVLEQPVHYVNKANPMPVFPYTSWQTAAANIQDAVAAAAAALPGSLVLVTNGVYDVGGVAVVENETNRVALTSLVVLRSVNGPEATTIQGAAASDGGNGDGAIRCVYVGTKAILSGFTLTNGHAGSGGGVWCEASGVVSNCVIRGNSATWGGGATGGTLYNCTLTGNSAQGHGGGVIGGTLYNCALRDNSAQSGGGAVSATLYNCSLIENRAVCFRCEFGGDGGGALDCRLHNCTLTGNSANYGGGGAAGGILYNCTLSRNSGDGADWSTLYDCVLTGNSGWGSSGATLYNCTLTDNSAGGVNGGTLYNCIAYFNTAGGGPNHADSMFEYSCTIPLPTNGVGNIDADPQLASTAHLSASSPCIGAGSAAYTTGEDIDGEPWADPPCMGADQLTPGRATGPLALQIQASDTHVKTGSVVSFTGLNTGPILRSVWDFGDGTRLTNRPFASHAWSAVGAYTVRLTGYNDGFPDGITTILKVTVSDGVSYVNLASAHPVSPYTSWETAANNIQSAIEFAAVGGVVWVTNGVYASGQSAWANTGNSRVAIHKAVQVQSVNGPGATVICGDDGTRCAYLGSRAILSGFTLTNGHAVNGGAVACEGSGVISNCVLTGNSADYGGGGAAGGTLYNSVLIGNSAWLGGGAYSASLYNCTFAANAAGDGGGAGFWCSFYNCVAYHNTAGFGPNHAYSSVDYSCTTPLPEGVGNIDADPRFVNLTVGDFRLRPDSPCIDAGTDLSAILNTDLDGLPRPLDGNGDGVARFDMGAYEFNPYHFMPTLQFSTNGFQFTVRGEPGKSVRIERSRDLVHWEFAGQVPIPASGQTLIDPATRTEPQMFYRALSMP